MKTLDQDFRHADETDFTCTDIDYEGVVSLRTFDFPKDIVRDGRQYLSGKTTSPTLGRQTIALTESYDRALQRLELDEKVTYSVDVDKCAFIHRTAFGPMSRNVPASDTRLLRKVRTMVVQVLAECEPAVLTKIYYDLNRQSDESKRLTTIVDLIHGVFHSRNLIQGELDFCPAIEDELQEKFEHLASQWEEETAFLSSITAICAHPAYQQIIGMGVDALPFIFADLSREPNHWFWALKSITGADPVSPEHRGNMVAMTTAWLEWAKSRGHWEP